LKKKSKLSEKDKKSWEDFLKNSPNIQDKEEKEIEKKKSIRYRFDLHGLSIEEASKKVTKVIENCYEKGISEILLITGQGHHSNLEKNVYVSKDHSTLKGTIPEFIKNTSSLSSKIAKIDNALPREGGKGALVIRLKNLKV
tara:strand:+ start:184 stop:606 length:423 start_codon:yes stop_codon:yes gene_type:complete